MRRRAPWQWLGLLLLTLVVVGAGVIAWQRDARFATVTSVPAPTPAPPAIDVQVPHTTVVHPPSHAADAPARRPASASGLLPLGPALQQPAPTEQSRLLAALASLPPDELAFRAQVERLSGAPPSPVVDAWLIRRRDGAAPAELRAALEQTWHTEPIAVRDAGRRMLTSETGTTTEVLWTTGPSRMPPLRRASDR